MSELAERQRLLRRARAASGSAHDRLIGAARVLLPVSVAVLAGVLAFAPVTIGRDLSFILSKDRVAVARERMRITRASYRGSDGKGQPFRLDAASAVQATSRDPIIRLHTLDGHIVLASGPATITGQQGRYDPNTQRLAIDGPVRFDGTGGYHIVTENVLLDMTTKILVSRGPASGTIPTGTFAADRMRADLDTKVVDLVGRARLHIAQARSRGAR